ncbi:MFS general substrate transporter [Phanerochaete sordida]|uniref:MFS general substrate transporter n=1 Tax=Phanerochaete sordida TaxID=48140 RepID=A0A9P3G4T8_9APHY|nr:MFS general substrate transporter [Phanerochaete sordida]
MPGVQPRKPWGLRWRSSVWYVTAIVGLGVMTDLLVYTIVIPVLPFQLERLGYSNVSGLVGWLLFAYSAGLVLSTPPIAMFSERYNTRTWPLVMGQVILIGSQIMLMLAPTYWLMVIARIIQGISSSIIWVVGLALLCDTASESIVGRQLGIAMTGLSLGMLVGPLAGGLLYHRFGFHGPGILAIIATAADLVGRLLIIERKDAIAHGVDPAADPRADEEATVQEGPASDNDNKEEKPPAAEGTLAGLAPLPPPQTQQEQHAPAAPATPRLSLLGVVRKLATSKRALTVMLGSTIYGMSYASQEPALPLHLQAVWAFDSSKVGLIYLAGVLPTLVSSPLAGWLADTRGAEWTLSAALLLALPWFGLLSVDGPLAFFIAMFCLENFFLAATVPPLTSELAAVARQHDGIGYAHVYGAFNLSFGVGSALGPVIGGQMYDHIRRGWAAICYFSIGALFVTAVLTACFLGDRPVLARLRTLRTRRQAGVS